MPVIRMQNVIVHHNWHVKRNIVDPIYKVLIVKPILFIVVQWFDVIRLVLKMLARLDVKMANV